jgi:hypothetical protein
MSRAERRAQVVRMKHRTRGYYGWPTDDPAELGKRAYTPARCSCWMCGNPRRALKGMERFTLRERRQAEAESCDD